MNKVLSIALIAGGLLLLDSPEAAAHKNAHKQHYSQDRYQSDSYGRDRHRRDYRERYRYRDHYNNYGRDYRGSHYKRSRHVPRWLQHKRSFLRWYQYSPLRRNKYIAWHVLFDIYRSERRYRH